MIQDDGVVVDVKKNDTAPTMTKISRTPVVVVVVVVVAPMNVRMTKKAPRFVVWRWF